MAARGTRLTARGTVVLVVLGLVATGGIAYLVLRELRPDCTVRVADHEVGLDRAAAEKASPLRKVLAARPRARLRRLVP